MRFQISVCDTSLIKVLKAMLDGCCELFPVSHNNVPADHAASAATSIKLPLRERLTEDGSDPSCMILAKDDVMGP